MICFDILMTFIEDIIFTYFNFKISNISNKLYFVVSVLLCFIATYVFNNIFLNNFLAIIFLILIHMIIAYFCTHEFHLYNAIIPTIIISILLISNTIALAIVLFMNNFNLTKLLNSNQSIILLSVISRLLFLTFSILFEKIQHTRFDKKLVISNDWISFFIFSFSLLETFAVLYESVFYQTISIYTILQLLFFIVCITVSFFVLFFHMQKDYYRFLQVNDQLAKTRYYNESYSKLNSLSYQITQDKHDMFYVLMKLKHLILNDKSTNDDAINFIDKYLNKIEHYDNIYTSSLPTYEAKLFSYFKN